MNRGAVASQPRERSFTSSLSLSLSLVGPKLFGVYVAAISISHDWARDKIVSSSYTSLYMCLDIGTITVLYARGICK